jgi:protein FAM32A
MGGKLKLKGSSTTKTNANSSSKVSTTVNINSKKRLLDETASTGPEVHLTDAQKRFKAKKAEMESKKAKELSSTSFRDRVEAFNMKLSKLTEHNDIPRVSAAGNG